MAELERIYKDTDTGGWGWVTQEATGGGAGFAPAAISLFYGGAQSFEQTVEEDVVGWEVDGPVIGDFFSLDPDTIHVIVPEACTVAVQCTFSFNGDNGSEWSRFDVYSTGDFFLDDGNAAVVFPVKPGGVGGIGQGNYTVMFTGAGTVRLRACPLGGTDVDTVDLGGMSVIRLA